MLTPRQQAFVTILKREMGKKGVRMSLHTMLLEAGYSEGVAKNPAIVFESEEIQKETQGFLGMLEDKRKLALTHMTEAKLEKSAARDLAYITDILTKNHQLLSGNKTENVEYKFEIT